MAAAVAVFCFVDEPSSTARPEPSSEETNQDEPRAQEALQNHRTKTRKSYLHRATKGAIKRLAIGKSKAKS